MATLPAIEYEAPAVNPAGSGLYAAATLLDSGSPTRLSGGVRVRPLNCGTGVGTWESDPCIDPDPTALKYGLRPTPPAPFEPIVVWAYDECDPTETEDAIKTRANQLLRLQESVLVESFFGERLLTDLGTPIPTATSLIAAVSALEVQLGETGFYGVIHASPGLAAYAAAANLIIRSGPLLKTPLGHTWAFGGGYASSLGNTLVATGPVTVWRDAVTSISSLDHQNNVIAAIAERTVVVGYECLVGGISLGSDSLDGSSIPGNIVPGNTTPGQ